MGQKVNPYSFRLGFIKTWQSKWFAKKKDFARYLHEDLKIREYIKRACQQAAVSKVEIERSSDKIRVKVATARPGVIIGRRGADIDRLKEELQEITGREVLIDIKEIKEPALDAQLVAENVAFQLERRIPYRRVMKKAVQTAMTQGARGIKVACGGRLAGAEIARHEKYKEGKIPLATLRADIDYGFAESLTTYGKIGVKVWIYKGDILPEKKVASGK